MKTKRRKPGTGKGRDLWPTHYHSSYGYAHGGCDPREFTPDPECCTPEEIERHREACAAWDRGERPATPGPHAPHPDGRAGWVTRSFFGLGVTTWACDGGPQCEF